MLDCICLKWIRLCHYFWSVCEIKTCCLFPPPNHESPPPPTHPSRTKISPKIVLGDSYQHLHSRESEKGEIPPPPYSAHMCMVFRADVLVCPQCHLPPDQNPPRPFPLLWGSSDVQPTVLAYAVVVMLCKRWGYLKVHWAGQSHEGQGFRVLESLIVFSTWHFSS